jgi:hypothetical protein
MGSGIEEIEARRAERKATRVQARQEQYAKDIVEIDRLEAELGDDRVAVLKMPSFVPGLPTVVVVKTPSKPHMNRFREMAQKAKDNRVAIGEAAAMLASSCIAFPEKEVYERMREEWPAIHDNAGIEAIRMGEAEGKG